MISYYLTQDAQRKRDISRASRNVLAQHEWQVLHEVAASGKHSFVELWKRQAFDWLSRFRFIEYNGVRYVLTEKGKETLNGKG